MPQRRLDNWIKAYLAYTDESESPEEYHKWVAISCIAGAIRRKAFFKMGYFLLYPNMYIILVGPPGRCKKSTSMRIGRDLLAAVPGINFTTDSITRERLIQDLSQSFVDGHSSMTTFSTEFASLLTSSGMDMVVFLTDIYDSPSVWSHKTKIGGTNTIKAPYLNLIGATTPDWMARAMPLDTVGIGLTSRIVFVFQDTPRKRKAFPELSPEQEKLWELLRDDLVSMSHISGEYLLSPEAKAMYEDWYDERASTDTYTDPRLSGYFERKPMHLMKLAMIIAASFRDDPIIHSSDLDSAMAMFNQVESKMAKVFEHIGKNPLAADYGTVGDAILRTPGISFATLLDRFKSSVRKDELSEILDLLSSSGKIIVNPGNTYTPTGKE